MDLQQISADIAESLVTTNEFNDILDYRHDGHDGHDGILVDVYAEDPDDTNAIRVLHTYRVNIQLTDVDAAPAPAPDDLSAYSAALDEIYALRTAAAYEAALLESLLMLKTFPVGRRQATIEQRERLAAAARGDAIEAYNGVPDAGLRDARDWAGMSHLLTRHQFEEGLRDR